MPLRQPARLWSNPPHWPITSVKQKCYRNKSNTTLRIDGAIVFSFSRIYLLYHTVQAIILAAGMGRRLGDLTKGHTKCMVEVNGVTLIDRVITQLSRLGLSRLVLVVGYQGDRLKGIHRRPLQGRYQHRICRQSDIRQDKQHIFSRARQK